MRRITALAATIAVCAALAIPAIAATPRVTWAAGVTKSVTISKGGSVTFVWGDNYPHNMTGAASNGSVRGRGRTVTKRFSRSGTVYCSFHPNMSVRVNAR